MENITYIGLSHQNALKHQMEVTANNLANMTTPGFKAQEVVFLEYMTNPKDQPDQRISMVNDYGSFRRMTMGPLKQTHNDLDIAIQGDGYFTVETPAGPRYTRGGSFMLNAEREIVTPQGYRLVGGGGAITVPEDVGSVSIGTDGTMSGKNGVFANIDVVGFNDMNGLREIGDNLMDANGQAPVAVENPRMAQGMIEGSNVTPVIEMNKMIEILRNYQSAQRILQTDHERIRGAIQKLTRV